MKYSPNYAVVFFLCVICAGVASLNGTISPTSTQHGVSGAATNGIGTTANIVTIGLTGQTGANASMPSTDATTSSVSGQHGATASASNVYTVSPSLQAQNQTTRASMKPTRTPATNPPPNGFLRFLQQALTPDNIEKLLDFASSIDEPLKSLIITNKDFIVKNAVPILQQFLQNGNQGNGNLPAQFSSLLNNSALAGIVQGMDMATVIQMILPSALSSVTGFKNVSGQCLRDISFVVSGLATGQQWALQMFDSFAKLPAGVMYGDAHWLGQYYECMRVKAHIKDAPLAGLARGDHSFNGEYCRAYITVPASVLPANIAGMTGATGGSMEISLGTCLPSTCTSGDLTAMLKQIMSQLKTRAVCEKDKVQHLSSDPTAIACICLLMVFGMAVLTGTLLEGFGLDKMMVTESQEKDTLKLNDMAANTDNAALSLENPKRAEAPTAIRLLTAFSLYTTLPRLLSTHQGSAAITCINGIRVMSMAWIVLGHTYSTLRGNMSNLLGAMKKTEDFSFQAITNAVYSVDTFFLLSGVLVAYLFLRQLRREKGPHVKSMVMYYVHRYTRLSPLYFMLLFSSVALMPYMGSGPLWPLTYPFKDPACSENWWTNILYVNNIVRPENMCFPISWYVANDFQFYVIAPLFILPLFWKPVVGVIFVVVGLVANGLAGGYALDALYKGGDFSERKFLTDYYMLPWCRVGPYLVGLVVGYILYKTDLKLKMHKAVVALGWFLSVSLVTVIVYVKYDEVKNGYWELEPNIAYTVVTKPLWAAALGWIIVACATGYGGFINTILSWSPWVPLGRLTYAVYLVHSYIQVVYVWGGRTTNITVSDFSQTIFFTAFLVLSYVAGLVASLLFEVPMLGVEKILLKK
ncbi:nose resistant to fluoxetine protein 6 [Lingula anatina]|uniref:Nose resistant to fluoxetine protein 6 n=1 Tax=Lingula anatina TaxID=7574 RepID=A0A1S3J0W5_LINAN|nr:nose resistant to fluoxetine protein 6 [Lingula anatina]|eukprot:XP_013404082.1 nose resistant to fluoxetine protein 6 [Lingula anatina]